VQVQDAAKDPYTVTPVNSSFTGVKSASHVSLTVPGETLTGQFHGSHLALDLPQTNGALET